MHNKSLKLCGFTLIMGIFGAFFRWVQNISSYEPDTGLSIHGSVWNYILLAFLIITALSFVFIVRRYRNADFSQDFEKALRSEERLAGIANLALAAAMGIGGLITLILSLSPVLYTFGVVTGGFALVCAVCFVVFFRSTGRDHANTRGAASSLIIVLFLCFWLIATYKAFASEPVIWRFAPRILAICAAILGYYYIAGYPFKKPRPMFCMYFCQLGAFLLIVSLADPLDFGEQLMTLSAAGMLLLVSATILTRALTQKSGEDTGEI